MLKTKEIINEFLLRHNVTDSPLGKIHLANTLNKTREPRDETMRGLGNSYALVYLLDGAGRHRTGNGLDIPVKSGDLILIFPKIAYTNLPNKNAPWVEIYFQFDGPVFDLWRAKGLFDPAQPVHHCEPVE